MVSAITHEQNIICSRTLLDGIAHEEAIICRQLIAGPVPLIHLSCLSKIGVYLQAPKLSILAEDILR